jgi:hypothetical protein
MHKNQKTGPMCIMIETILRFTVYIYTYRYYSRSHIRCDRIDNDILSIGHIVNLYDKIS